MTNDDKQQTSDDSPDLQIVIHLTKGTRSKADNNQINQPASTRSLRF